MKEVFIFSAANRSNEFVLSLALERRKKKRFARIFHFPGKSVRRNGALGNQRELISRSRCRAAVIQRG